jgi:hypothetical protein
MHSFGSITIIGYRGEQVPNSYIRQQAKSDHLAILMPGLNYTCDMPLLYYSAGLLLARGADVLRVECAYNRRVDFQSLPETEQERWVFADSKAACETALAQRSYHRVTLIGKSLGTLAMGYVLSSVPTLADARAIWLTPLLRNEKLRSEIREGGQCSLFVIGTVDSNYDSAFLAEARAATNGETLVIEGANHALEVNDDVFKSLQVIERVMLAIQTFLAENRTKH